MTDKTHLAIEANKLSIKYAMERNKEAWLALYTDDAVVCDPVGDGNFTECDMLAVYHVNAEGLITSMKAHWSFDDMMAQLGKLGTA